MIPVRLRELKTLTERSRFSIGVSIISRLAVERELQAGSLISLTIAGVPLERDLLLCWHHERRFSNLATVFIRFLQKQMREGAA